MFEIHQRAAKIANGQNITWQNLVPGRFVGRLPDNLSRVPTEMAIQTTEIVVETDISIHLRGVIEYASDPTVQVVRDFAAVLNLETHEISIQESTPANAATRSYAGFLSENGRVMSLRAPLPDGTASKPFHLVHEPTLVELASG